MKRLKNTWSRPFEVSVFADPSGAFTTAAGMVAITEKSLKQNFDCSLDGSNVVILGGTGPVGVASAVICAKAGANVILIGRNIEKVGKVAGICNDRYKSKNVKPGADADKSEYFKIADVVLNTGAAARHTTDDRGAYKKQRYIKNMC